VSKSKTQARTTASDQDDIAIKHLKIPLSLARISLARLRLRPTRRVAYAFLASRHNKRFPMEGVVKLSTVREKKKHISKKQETDA
jgi:hypothetical protein